MTNEMKGIAYHWLRLCDAVWLALGLLVHEAMGQRMEHDEMQSWAIYDDGYKAGAVTGRKAERYMWGR